MNLLPSTRHAARLALAAGTAVVATTAPAGAAPFYLDSGFEAMATPDANQWGESNLTNSSAIFEAFIDFTPTVAATTAPFTVFELGADGFGAGVAIHGPDIVFAAGGGSVAETAVATGPHGLAAGRTGVQIVAVIEMNGGTDGNELLSLYVDGSLVATADSPARSDDWAGANGSHLGVGDGFSIFEYVPSINPNAGDGANGRYAGDFPDPDTVITFAAYLLDEHDVADILAASAPVVLVTDFTEVATTAGDTTATGIPWKARGVAPPASTLTLVDVLPEVNTSHDASFADDTDLLNVRRNLVNEGGWSTTIADVALAPGTPSMDLTALWIRVNGTTNTGASQDGTKIYTVTAEIFDSSAISLGSASLTAGDPGEGNGDPDGVGTMFDLDLSGIDALAAGDTYDLVLTLSTPTGDGGQNASIDDLLLWGSAPLSGGPVLVITPNATTIGHYDFEWDSQGGMVYDLVSALDLATAPASWAVWEGQADLEAAPPTNTLTDIPGGADSRRFFAVVEKEAPPPPPLLEEDFEGGHPETWVAEPDTGTTVWSVGTPDGTGTEPGAAAGGDLCAGTNMNGNYADSANARLITPSFTVPADGATLELSYYIDTEQNVDGQDFGTIRLLDADGNPLAGGEVATDLQGISLTWNLGESLALPATANGLEVKLEFGFESDDDAQNFAGFYIDDVVVTAN